MLIAFDLSMPGRASWNGRWSGEEQPHVLVRNIRSKKTAERVLGANSYSYSFGDGWVASVHVREVCGQESRKLRRKSAGFSGYDWMVESIVLYGEIRCPSRAAIS